MEQHLANNMKKFLIIILLLFLTGCQPIRFGAGEITAEGIASKYNTANEIKAKYQLDDVSLIKKDIKNAELDKYKGEPKDEIKVTIGDNTPVIEDGFFGANEIKEFKPDIELKRWNEVSFKLKTGKLLSGTKNKTMSLEGDRIKYKTDKMDFEMYSPDDENYKYVWYLNEKPEKNVVEFEIESSGLDFFYQPPLTQEYKNGYSEKFQKEITVTETQVKDLDGNVLMERPENVVGSYTVYHSTKGGMNDINGKEYKTGKAFHIYRPHLFDANGLEAWGNLHIENGIYSVEIPQDFLDKAVYPIKSNDSFGYTTLGATIVAFSANQADSMQYSAPADGVVTSISWGCSSPTSFFKALLFTHSDLNIVANGVGDATALPATKNWGTSTFSISPTIISGTSYLLGTISNASVAEYYDAAGGGTNLNHFDSSNSYTTPQNMGTASTFDDLYSFYATYTPTGGGGTTATSTPSAIFNGNTIINSDIIIN